jgi:16S rRNA processing protein RimM
VLIPFLRDVVVEVHRDEGRLVIDPPEGLLEL